MFRSSTHDRFLTRPRDKVLKFTRMTFHESGSLFWLYNQSGDNWFEFVYRINFARHIKTDSIGYETSLSSSKLMARLLVLSILTIYKAPALDEHSGGVTPIESTAMAKRSSVEPKTSNHDIL